MQKETYETEALRERATLFGRLTALFGSVFSVGEGEGAWSWNATTALDLAGQAGTWSSWADAGVLG
jgi:hypothetical protein